jgi:hypothetical protein
MIHNCGQIRKRADASDLIGLLRPRRECPRRRAAEKRDELAAADRHSISSSARARRCLRMPDGLNTITQSRTPAAP